MARVLVPLAQGCEELEAITIIDLLRRANVEVVSASLDDQPVHASRGTVIIADTTLDNTMHQEFDMIVLPGGLPGADHLNEDPRIEQLLLNMTEQNKFTAAICAAPKVLANSGLLEGKRATAFPGTLEKLNLPNTTLDTNPVVQDGNVITSRGPGTAMDFTLTLIENLVGTEVRSQVEAGLQRP